MQCREWERSDDCPSVLFSLDISADERNDHTQTKKKKNAMRLICVRFLQSFMQLHLTKRNLMTTSDSCRRLSVTYSQGSFSFLCGDFVQSLRDPHCRQKLPRYAM